MFKKFQRLFLDSRLTRRQTREDEEDCQVVSRISIKIRGKKRKAPNFILSLIHLIKDPETSRLIIYPLGNLPNPGMLQPGTPALQMDSEPSEALYVEKGNPNATYILN